MAVKKKYKKLTNAEKKFNKEIKETLIKEGIIPPKKKPLNRRKFAQEINIELKEGNLSIEYLSVGMSCMRPTGDYKTKITDEEVGVLKAYKMAIEYKKYVDIRHEEDELAKITLGDIYENVIKPIRDL